MSNIPNIKVTWHLWEEEIRVVEIAKRLGVHRATVYRWIKSFKIRGYKRTLNYYQTCKKHSRRRWKSTGYNKQLVYKIRKEYNNCCGEKIRYYLKKEYEVKMSVKTIYLILNEKYVLRSKYKKNKYGEAPKGTKEREVIQADTVDFGEVYAYTYVDTFTRQAYVDLELDLESESGYASLEEAGKILGRIDLIQTDGGSEFEGEFKRHIVEFAGKHRVSRPYKKNEQSFIESFNRTLRKECLGWRKYNRKELSEMKKRVKKFLKFYNDYRPHLSLDMKTPNEIALCRI